MKIRMIAIFAAAMVFIALAGQASALEVTASQAGADSDEIMKGRAFTVEAAGWEGDCTTAILSFSGCSGCSLDESYTKSVGDDTTVTWTTASASQKASAQTVSVTMNGCSGESDVSSSFDVVLPPSLSMETSTETASLDAGDSFDVTVNVANDGETAANSVVITVSGTGMSITSGCSPITSLAEEQSSAQTCTVTASTGGTQTVTFTVSASNADDATDSFSMTVIGGSEPDDPGGPGGGNTGGLGGVGPGATVQNRTKAQQMSPGLLNNTRLQAAIERVLGQARMSEQARQNMMQLSARITGDFSSSHGFTYDGTKSRIRNTVRYNGREKVKNFVLFEKVPKEFAQSASLVTVSAPGGTAEVAEDDPSWAILYPEVNPGDVLTVTYEVTGVKSGDVLDNVTMEVYAESVEAAAGTDDTGGEEAPGGQEGPGGVGLPSFALDTNTMLMIAAGVLAFVVVAAAVVLLRRKGGGRKAASPAVVPQAAI